MIILFISFDMLFDLFAIRYIIHSITELVVELRLIDNSVIEVYANKRQAICRRVYPTDPKNSTGVKLIGKAPEKLDTYKMFPSNPY